jgi:hypothetical protein
MISLLRDHPLSADTCSKRIAAATRRQCRSRPLNLIANDPPKVHDVGNSPGDAIAKREHGKRTQERIMGTTRRWCVSVAAIALAAVLAASPAQLNAQQTTSPGISIGDNDLGGVVSGPSGPEAGVWVIAETTDLPTKFAKMVVTDDQGRYVLPDLPKANYSIWVRGYGLVDSQVRPARRST